MQLWKCFALSPLRSACLAIHHAPDYKENKNSVVAARMQKRWLSSETTVKARSESLAIWAALMQLSENINKAMCVVLLRLKKNKFQHSAFLLSTLALLLTELSKVFRAGCFDFAQVKASVELCISKLSDALFKSELKANCEKFGN